MTPIVFIGLDLAWSVKNNTAAAVISYDLSSGSNTGILTDWAERLDSNQEILDFVGRVAGSVPTNSALSPNLQLKPALIAIDAPLSVPNQDGSRECDRHLSHVFRRFQAGTHPANRTNLGRYGNPVGDIRSETLLRQLTTQCGFTYSPYVEPRSQVRQVFECYPHPAMVVLFNLPKTLKYKRKLRSVANDRFEAYDQLQNYLRSLAATSVEPRLQIPVELLGRNTRQIKGGAALKQYEDLLDAIICAYIAFYYWWLGAAHTYVFGNLESGHIVTPITPALREEAVKHGKAKTPTA